MDFAMKHSLRRQILLPVVALLLVAVTINVFFAAWLASTTQARAIAARQQQIVEVLAWPAE